MATENEHLNFKEERELHLNGVMQVFQMADEFVKPRYKEFINFEETEISNILKEF